MYLLITFLINFICSSHINLISDITIVETSNYINNSKSKKVDMSKKILKKRNTHNNINNFLNKKQKLERCIKKINKIKVENENNVGTSNIIEIFDFHKLENDHEINSLIDESLLNMNTNINSLVKFCEEMENENIMTNIIKLINLLDDDDANTSETII
ncbi:hypothetical protein NAPIS_ORF02510 [Vairimorpha apis BRL 01]|uniref:Uncharacterized protein n=1 Tax=Vairimorpha apis BRL 01 TaxID=1037528 RepID=T0KX03_9MICR|nr:hypothetical protein NAPIS_ORF02510 [Vairimorpha apis BRL 01]